jgi:hypothetical protein
MQKERTKLIIYGTNPKAKAIVNEMMKDKHLRKSNQVF